MNNIFNHLTDEQLYDMIKLYSRHLGKTTLLAAIAEELMMRKMFK